jgi:hypothetical protein
MSFILTCDDREAKKSHGVQVPCCSDGGRTALVQLQKYLLADCHLLHVHQITETELQGWFAFLNHTPKAAGKHVQRARLKPMPVQHRPSVLGLSSEERLPIPPYMKRGFLGRMFLFLISSSQIPSSR